ncbi:MAG: hypothetical protein K0B02_04400 [DPANN group archaeon]|nr:hypothetical protein [DPANN group archaeon]
MSSIKKYSKKIRLIAVRKEAKPAPRWADLKLFGLLRARFKSIKRFKSRQWRRSQTIDY